MNKDKEVNEKGYVIWKDSGKLVHRWVAEKKYGKEEIKGKHIHHIDGKKKNNDKSNLLLIDKEDHYHLTKHENRNKLLLKIIIFLAVYYTLMSWILMYFPVPKINKEIFLASMRVSVFFILLTAIELRFGFINQLIRNPGEKYFDLN